MRSKGFINNSMWMICGKIAQMILTLIIGSISARYLGPDNYGLINYGASYTALFAPIISLGLYGIIVNEIVKEPKNDGVILGTTIIMRVAAALFSTVCILLLVFMINPNHTLLLIVTALQCISIMFQWCEVFNFWCQSRFDSKTAVIIQLLAYIVASVYKIYLLISGKSVTWFAFSMGFDYIFQAICYILYFRKQGNTRLCFKVGVAKYLLKNSYHYIFSALASVIYSQIDRIMLGAMLGTTFVGLYTAAYTISSMWTFVLTAIIDSIRPVIIRARQTSLEIYKTRIIQLYSVIIYLSIVVSIAMCLFAKLIILILYGESYLRASNTVGILTWSTAFSFLGVARSIWCVCENRQKYEKYLSIAGALINVIMNFILIPFWGINGAAVATLITQIATNFLVPLGIKGMRENSIYIIKSLDVRCILNRQFIRELKKT